MEAYRFMKLKNDEQRMALEGLLDVFSSVFSLEEIASVYCKAGKNAALAGAMLYDMQETTSSSSTTFTTNSETRSEKSSDVSSGEMSYSENRNSRAPKTRVCPASMGNVSTVIGKGYWRPKESANRTSEATKPLKLDQKDLPMSKLWCKESNSAKDDSTCTDVEDFLFTMLGDGFKLDRDMIQEVLGSCGYNMEKSMEKLLGLSAATLEKRDDIQHNSTKESSENCLNVEPPSSAASYCNRVLQTNEKEKLMEEKGRCDIQKEVLTSLFSVPKWADESSRSPSPVSTINRSRTFGQLVDEPLRGTPAEHKTTTINQHHENEDDEHDSYKVLREAVEEYRAITKEYYKSAVAAFVKGDQVRADKLLEQGLFFQEKAREANEESEKVIFKTRDDEAITLDLHDRCAKEAVRLLKCHLSSLSGIPSMTCLKVIMERNGQDTSKGARKRLIMRLLEKESIKWAEDMDAGTILIRLNEINRKHLSFVKNY